MIDFKDFVCLNTLEKSKSTIVFKAKHRHTKKTFAIKMVKKNGCSPNSIYLKSISHKNIIQCYSINEIFYNNTLYHMYVLEWANCKSLREYLNEQRDITLGIILQILNAISFLHKKNLIHGDIKPENVLLNNDKNLLNVKISDYNTLMLGEKNYIITPEYSAPDYKEMTIKYDIWSIGCLLFEFYFKKQPFGSRNNGESIEMILNNIAKAPIPKEVLNLKEPFKYIIFRCLKKNQKERFNSVDEIIFVLNNFSIKMKIKASFEYFKAIIKKEIK